MPGALTAMVNWYRALLTKHVTLDAVRRITIPTLIVWGTGDKFGIPELAERSRALCDIGSVVFLDSSHWIQHDEPERVNAMLLDFLAGGAT
jgi:pimeloyl-ACP methyl ester carboxylesterase